MKNYQFSEQIGRGMNSCFIARLVQILKVWIRAHIEDDRAESLADRLKVKYPVMFEIALAGCICHQVNKRFHFLRTWSLEILKWRDFRCEG